MLRWLKRSNGVNIMKRLIETKARIEKKVEIPLKSREVNIGDRKSVV